MLLGYYGQKNFGDDVLMAVAYQISQQIMPGASIALRTSTSETYPTKLLGASISHLPFGTRDEHSLIIHGGGGTFFDFGRHTLAHRLRNKALFAAGTTAFLWGERRLRLAMGKPRLAAQKRIGLGMGIGTFSAGSPKLLEALPVLEDFDALWVRDLQSRSNIERLRISPPIIEGSDLAFLTDGWCPSSLRLSQPPSRPARPRVGVILRDWPTASGTAFGQRIAPTLEYLARQYDLTLISLDQNTDQGTLQALRHLPQVIWQPDRDSFEDFATKLVQQDVLLTSRAHGAICGACVGRASVILEIEPKLSTVHAMLPRASRLIAPDSNGAEVAKTIEEALSIPLDAIAADVYHNGAASKSALNSVVMRAGL